MYNEAARGWQLLWEDLVEAVDQGTLYTLKPDKDKQDDTIEEVGH